MQYLSCFDSKKKVFELLLNPAARLRRKGRVNDVYVDGTFTVAPVPSSISIQHSEHEL